ncbi:MAG: hypothetical protein P4K93_00045 [Terracidiphilus sp.]|nr:hypothetical protein [Terracidiphilus sp.]
MRPANPELKELVVEASRALACLDRARLEELALSCQALTWARDSDDIGEREDLARQAREAKADMAVFARVLEATRSNLNVMKRLRELRAGRLEYTERQARGGAGAGSPSTSGSKSRSGWSEAAEGGHGDD